MGKKKTSFLFKDLDHKWWRKVKIEALKHDLTLRAFVISCIEQELQNSKKGGN